MNSAVPEGHFGYVVMTVESVVQLQVEWANVRARIQK